MTGTLTLQHIIEATDGALLCGDADTTIGDIKTDSRIPMSDGDLFVALRGPNFDGHQYLADAAQAGATVALVEQGRRDEANDFDHVVTVDDTLVALQRIAAFWRSSFGGSVIGITGSNGKTIVKEMLTSVLGRTATVHRSPGSFNSQVGVPLSVLGMRTRHDHAIIEAGISEVGEMEQLAAVIAPDIGIITNVGEAHLAGFGAVEVTAREKLRLFEGMSGALVWPADDPIIRTALSYRSGPTVSFGESDDADYRIAGVKPVENGYTFRIVFPGGADAWFQLHALGRHNVHNAAAAIAAADVLGVPTAQMQAGVSAFELSPMRLEMHTTGAGVTLLNDAYSSDPVSAAAALQTLVQYAAGQRTIAILGDMLDLGSAAAEAHAALGNKVASFGIDHLICVGDLARGIGEASANAGVSAGSIQYAAALDELEPMLDDLLEPGDFVLFKGSRAMGLERAAQSLLESVAPARLYVDLEAIRDNVQAIRRHIGHDGGVMAVVKSFGYGNDANRVALTLASAGVDAFAVAYPDEAIPLRRRGIDRPILVTNVRASEADKIVKYGLIALVFENATVDALQREAQRRGVTIDVHVEVDTGMNRLGVEPQDALAFCIDLDAREHLHFAGIMTHFAAADDPDEDEFTRSQIAAFEGVLQRLDNAGIRPPVVHAANTAAAWRFPESRYDMVRIGLGLYGVHPSSDVARATAGVEPAIEFVTEVIHINEVSDGESVGYGRTWRASGPRRIATIAAGYNDGFPRFMSNGGEVLIGGARCPVVGNVCMDVSMVDVTGVDVEVGDEAVLFGTRGGETITIEEIASRGRTINYEILTNISPRVRRIFRRG